MLSGLVSADAGSALNSSLRLNLHFVDYLIILIYFGGVLSIGFVARRKITSSLDFFLAGRSMPAWITGLAFVSANLGATEILGMAANGAQIGMSTLHYYILAGVPAMVFLGLVMMPFYYNSGVRSVPEFMLKRFGKAPHLVNAISFLVANILIAGINLYAMSIIIEAMLGWDQKFAILLSAAFVLVYITLGGLSGAIYNEVLQFFVIVAALVPLTLIGLHRVGGWGGLSHAITQTQGVQHLEAWGGTAIGHVTNPIGANWLMIVLGLGFVLGFGYWTTNFTEVQRALSAKNLDAARKTPIFGAFPKILIPFIVVIPGLIGAAVLGNKLGPNPGQVSYNEVIPKLMQMYLPSGLLGIAVTGLLASFMAGMAANVSSFNTVFCYDIWERYIKPKESDEYYLKLGRIITIIGVIASVSTALLAARASNIMTYMQTLFSFFNAPLFAVFIIGLLWKRTSTAGAFWGYLAGIAAPTIIWVWYLNDNSIFANGTAETLYGAVASFIACAVVAIGISLVTKPKPDSELVGLVRGLNPIKTDEFSSETAVPWYRSVTFYGLLAVLLGILLYIPFK